MANNKPARRFRSSIIYEGLIRATTRSFLYALDSTTRTSRGRMSR